MNQGSRQLVIQTSSLIAGCMVWVLISSFIPFISKDIKMTSTEIAWVTAAPVIAGSILRVPIGFLTHRYGAKALFTVCFSTLLLPIISISNAKSFSTLLIGSLLLGIGGAVFPIGVTVLPQYFSKNKHGFINGIYGTGNIGIAFTAFLAPYLANQYGWRAAINMYLLLVFIFALLNFLLGDRKKQHIDHSISSAIKKIYKKPKLWCLSLFYFLTFGSFVAITIFLPSFLVNHFNLNEQDAEIRTAGFILIATFFRPIGGWLGDKMNAFVILMMVFLGFTFAGFLLSITPSLPIYSFGCVLVAFCSGVGNGAIFKLAPYYFSKQAGIVNGIISAFGGLGGFFPLLVLTFVDGMTEHVTIGFMFLSEISLACLVIVISLFYQDKHITSTKIIENAVYGICVTDTNGIIQRVNRSFTNITGYEQNEVIGKTPSVLQSGEHDIVFYKKMWDALNNFGYWEGFIWNKRKNQEIYEEWLTITAIKDDTGDTRNYVGMFSEVKITNK